MQGSFCLAHRKAVGDPYLIVGVFGSVPDVDGILKGKRVAEDDELRLSLSRGAPHLLRILKLGDGDAAKPQSDFSNDFRGQSRHQKPDHFGHSLSLGEEGRI